MIGHSHRALLPSHETVPPLLGKHLSLPTHMPQFILILAATIILGLYGYSQHEGQARDDRATMVREIEAAALNVAEEWSGHVRDLAFDEADVGAREVRVRNETDGLTLAFGPEAGEDPNDPRSFDDVDDFHEFSRRVTSPVGRGANQVAFDVEVEVSYARLSDWQPVHGITTAKVVNVTVRESTTAQRGRPLVQVVLPVRLTPAHQFAHR